MPLFEKFVHLVYAVWLVSNRDVSFCPEFEKLVYHFSSCSMDRLFLNAVQVYKVLKNLFI